MPLARDLTGRCQEGLYRLHVGNFWATLKIQMIFLMDNLTAGIFSRTYNMTVLCYVMLDQAPVN